MTKIMNSTIALDENEQPNAVPRLTVFFDKDGIITGSISENTDKIIVEDYYVEDLARILLPRIQQYFDDPQLRARFEEWQRSQCGSVC